MSDQGRRRNSGLFALLRSQSAPLDLQIVGRTLFHALIVGAAAGVVGAGFFAALEYLQRVLLEDLAGYHILRAHGELFVGDAVGTLRSAGGCSCSCRRWARWPAASSHASRRRPRAAGATQ